MYAQVEKPKENKSRGVANSVAQTKSDVEQGFGFVDNRPEAVMQRKLQDLANSSPSTMQLKAFLVSSGNESNGASGIESSIDIDKKMTSTSPIQRVQIMVFGQVLWDTTWDITTKIKNAKKIDQSRIGTLLWKLGKEGHTGMDDIQLIKGALATEWDTSWDAAEKRRRYASYDEDQRHEVIENMEKAGNGDELRLLQEIAAELVPESTKNGAAPAGKFPDTQVNTLHVHDNSPGFSGYVRFLAKSGEELGVNLIIWTNKEQQKQVYDSQLKSDYPDLSFEVRYVETALFSIWAEDSIEHLMNGNMAVLEKFRSCDLEEGIAKGRKERWGEENVNAVTMGTSVNDGNTGGVKKEKNGGASTIRAYIEGGNMITIGNCVLIGKDALAASMHAYNVTSEVVTNMIAEDFSLNPKNIIYVEQPGKFHLDMGLMSVGKNTVVVNNSKEKLESPMNPELTKRLKLICKLEDQAAKDLTDSGITVLRMNLENHDPKNETLNFNFFNGEYVKGANGKSYYITNGADPEKQQAFRAFMKKNKVVEDVYFAPLQLSVESLKEQGGIGCRVKGEVMITEDIGKLIITTQADIPVISSSVVRLIEEVNFSKLRKTYYGLALKFHPDKGGNTSIMQQIVQAYNKRLENKEKTGVVQVEEPESIHAIELM